MTQKHALLKSICLWTFLEATGKDKYEYPVKELLATRYHSYCALCETADHIAHTTPPYTSQRCDFCIMKNHWTLENHILSNNNSLCPNCINQNLDFISRTHYWKWERSYHNTNKAKHYAGLVLQSLIKRYKELYGNIR